MGGEDKEQELGWRDFSAAAALSPDGTMLLIADQSESGPTGYTVTLRSAGSSRPTELGRGVSSALSPDGHWALTIQLTRPSQLVLLPLGPGDSVSLPRDPVDSYERATFLDAGRVLFVGAQKGRPNRTWLQDVAGGQPRTVTAEGVVGTVTSPDGRLLAAVTQDSQLVITPIDGDAGQTKVVGTMAPGARVCQWGADGYTLFLERPGVRFEVSALDVRSGARQTWKTLDLPDPAGAGVYSFVMTRDGRSYAYTYIRFLDELYVVEGLK